MTYDILATGSSGNAVVINDEILIDCGVPMKRLRESGYIKSLKLVLLTHAHGDHFNPATVRALLMERPALRWGCCEWMVWEDREKRVPGPLLKAGAQPVCIYLMDVAKKYMIPFENKPFVDVMPESLIHDVPNCGWHIDDYSSEMFYATDTSTLDHIEAKNYDYYLIEANHTRAEIEARIEDKLARGEFAYEVRAARNHLSQEQALEWLSCNISPERWDRTEIVFLHQHKEKEER